MHANSYIHHLTEIQILSYVLSSIFEGKSKDQIVDRFDGDTVLVKTWIDVLKQIGFVVTNHFNELVITADGKDHLQKFESHWCKLCQATY
jgi:predicted methyltransferase